MDERIKKRKGWWLSISGNVKQCKHKWQVLREGKELLDFKKCITECTIKETAANYLIYPESMGVRQPRSEWPQSSELYYSCARQGKCTCSTTFSKEQPPYAILKLQTLLNSGKLFLERMYDMGVPRIIQNSSSGGMFIKQKKGGGDVQSHTGGWINPD